MTPLNIEPAALDSIDALDDVLYGRVYDLIDALKVDPFAPDTPGRVHMLTADGKAVRAKVVRSGSDEVMVLWVAERPDVRVIYVGPNTVL